MCGSCTSGFVALFVKVTKKRLQSFCCLTIKYYFCTRFPAMGSYQSGQMGQTVNLLALAFGGSNPSLPTNKKSAQQTYCWALLFFYSIFIPPSSACVLRGGGNGHRPLRRCRSTTASTYEKPYRRLHESATDRSADSAGDAHRLSHRCQQGSH